MIGIGTPNSQSKIPRPINHPLIATLRVRQATPTGCARMYAGVRTGVGPRLQPHAPPKSKLAADHLGSLAHIHVDTDENGVVWLSGSAHNQEAV